MKLTDAQLLKALASGDRQAFEQLYLSHKDELLTVASWLVRDPQAAEDLAHETFLSFVQRAGKLNGCVKIRPYLVVSCANKARDYLRRNKRLQDYGKLLERPDRAAAEPPNVAMRREEATRIVELVSKLPIEQRMVLAMRIHGELTFREIAESTSTPINTVQSRYRYAIASLRQTLHGEETNSCAG